MLPLPHLLSLRLYHASLPQTLCRMLACLRVFCHRACAPPLTACAQRSPACITRYWRFAERQPEERRKEGGGVEREERDLWEERAYSMTRGETVSTSKNVHRVWRAVTRIDA